MFINLCLFTLLVFAQPQPGAGGSNQNIAVGSMTLDGNLNIKECMSPCCTDFYDDADVAIESNVKYGSAFHLDGTTPYELFLDIYEVKQRNAADPFKNTKKPVAVLVHGGGFSPDSHKDDELSVEGCTGWAKRGFVCVSVEYRRWGGVSGATNLRTRNDPALDLQAALRYLVKEADNIGYESANGFGIDAEQMVLYGGSAGGLTISSALLLNVEKVAAKEHEVNVDNWNLGYPPSEFCSRNATSVNCHCQFDPTRMHEDGCNSGNWGSRGIENVKGVIVNSGGIDIPQLYSEIEACMQRPYFGMHFEGDTRVNYNKATAAKNLLDRSNTPNSLLTDPGNGHVLRMFEVPGYANSLLFDDIYAFALQQLDTTCSLTDGANVQPCVDVDQDTFIPCDNSGDCNRDPLDRCFTISGNGMVIIPNGGICSDSMGCYCEILEATTQAATTASATTMSPSTSPTTSPTTSPSSSPTESPTTSPSSSPTSANGHFTACGRPNQCAGGTEFTMDDEVRAVRCVADYSIPGWFQSLEEPTCADRWQNLWWESDVWGECKMLNFADAASFCASMGARLPTLSEVEDGCVSNSGCRYDRQSIWTSTESPVASKSPSSSPKASTTDSPTLNPSPSPTVDVVASESPSNSPTKASTTDSPTSAPSVVTQKVVEFTYTVSLIMNEGCNGMTHTAESVPFWYHVDEVRTRPFGECTTNVLGSSVIFQCMGDYVKEHTYIDAANTEVPEIPDCSGDILFTLTIENGCNDYSWGSILMEWGDVCMDAQSDPVNCNIVDAINYNPGSDGHEDCDFGHVCSYFDTHTIIDVRNSERIASADGFECAAIIPVYIGRQPIDVISVFMASGGWENPIAVYSSVGVLAADAVTMLQDAGFTNVVNIGRYDQIKAQGCSCPRSTNAPSVVPTESPSPSSDGADYVLASIGATACPRGFAYITNMEECNLAQKALDGVAGWNGEELNTHAHRMPFCWVGRAKEANYNPSGDWGADFSKSSLICKRYEFALIDGAPGSGRSPAEVSDPDPTQTLGEVQCCKRNGVCTRRWPDAFGVKGDCLSGDNDALKFTLQGAVGICGRLGSDWDLCTRTQTNKNNCKHKGCQHDHKLVWVKENTMKVVNPAR